MQLKPGSRWRSAVCTAEVVVVRPPKGEVSLECGGHPMVAAGAAAPEGLALSPDFSSGVVIGKRYQDEDVGIEVLAAKAGQGSLAVNGRALSVREAKALPASD